MKELQDAEIKREVQVSADKELRQSALTAG